jgi:DNA integrity scanning protein DisA with diadenylate cyclase activity
MSQALATLETVPPVVNRERAVRILSKSLYRDLRENGYEAKQIVALASELIEQVTTDIKDQPTLA